jgi:hypothetical protein
MGGRGIRPLVGQSRPRVLEVPLPPPHARPKSPKPLPLTMQAVVFGLGLGYLHSRYSSIFGRKRRGYQRIGEAQRDL